MLGLAAAGSKEAAELAAMIALLVGACFLIARLLRIGWVADYLSRPVLIGYIHGVAVVLIIGQLAKLTGIDVDAVDPVPKLVEVGREIGDVSGSTLAVGIGALAVLLPLRFLAPRLPAPLIVVIAAIAVLLFLTGPIADLPKAVLGAVIVGAAIGLIEPAAWRGLWATDRVEVTFAAVTTAGVLLAGVLEAIVFAAGLSIVDVVRRSARPHDAVLGWVERLGRWADVAVHRDAKVAPGVVVYRLDDRLFFANVSYVKGRVREALRGAPAEPIGADHFHPTVRAAVEAALRAQSPR